tara:strand:+ start:362 stop:1051 length:690 start_codon:yes stop_codon:yes gene_type:complete
MKIIAIILARGNSQGIPKKNLVSFCGKPLLYWSLKQAKDVKEISDVWVSSDNDEILEFSKKNGAKIIRRPKNISKNTSTSESGYHHAINEIENNSGKIDLVIALQPTSPIRESSDIKNAIKKFKKMKYDSMFSASDLGDFMIWKQKNSGNLYSWNYDSNKRPRRQDFEKQYLENGSFYIFKPDVIKKFKNRFGKNIGIFLMDFWKAFEINETKDIEFCELLMKHYLLRK